MGPPGARGRRRDRDDSEAGTIRPRAHALSLPARGSAGAHHRGFAGRSRRISGAAQGNPRAAGALGQSSESKRRGRGRLCRRESCWQPLRSADLFSARHGFGTMSLICATRTLTKHLWLNLAVAAISARAVYGQGRARVTPSVTTTGEYDSNVFATAADPQADVVTRGSMGLGVDYTAPRWTTSSRYVHDVERFENHPHLSSADARQRAALAFQFQPT